MNRPSSIKISTITQAKAKMFKDNFPKATAITLLKHHVQEEYSNLKATNLNSATQYLETLKIAVELIQDGMNKGGRITPLFEAVVTNKDCSKLLGDILNYNFKENSTYFDENGKEINLKMPYTFQELLENICTHSNTFLFSDRKYSLDGTINHTNTAKSFIDSQYPP